MKGIDFWRPSGLLNFNHKFYTFRRFFFKAATAVFTIELGRYLSGFLELSKQFFMLVGVLKINKTGQNRTRNKTILFVFFKKKN